MTPVFAMLLPLLWWSQNDPVHSTWTPSEDWGRVKQTQANSEGRKRTGDLNLVVKFKPLKSFTATVRSLLSGSRHRLRDQAAHPFCPSDKLICGSNLMTRDLIPGVIVAVPLPQRRVPAARCVMASQGVPGVVGHGVQVVDGTLCTNRRQRSFNDPSSFPNPDSLCFLLQTLTAAHRCKLSQVQIFEREVYVGGKFARSDVGVWETLQVWGGRRGQGIKTEMHTESLRSASRFP